ncbi:MAG TPA: Hsp20/alpha crystallin family protein [Polyangia bacterium]|nr:Hsp20/alpha crystallin family protein [Polyangia bacterium]
MATLIRRDTRDAYRRPLGSYFLSGSPFSAFGDWTSARPFAPEIDVRETKDAYVFRADVPGITQNDIEVQLTGNVLAIAGERKTESTHEGERAYANERTYGRFSRSFVLPDGVDGEHVTADLKDGVLTVTVPKKPEVQPKRIVVGGGTPPAAAKA